MSLFVEFPEELLVASQMDKATFTRQVMFYVLGHLYDQGKISSSLGARILGCDRWEFFSILSENGFAVIDYPMDELSNEVATSRELARQLKKI
jgi:hypothetical protein